MHLDSADIRVTKDCQVQFVFKFGKNCQTDYFRAETKRITLLQNKLPQQVNVDHQITKTVKFKYKIEDERDLPLKARFLKN